MFQTFWKLQESSDRKLLSCARCSIKKLLPGENHDRMLIGEPGQAQKLASKIADFVDKLFKSIALNILSKMYDMFVTSLYGRALCGRFDGAELYSIGNKEK